MQRLKGYAEVKIVGMQYHYKSSNGQRLPNPPRGCPVSLQLEPSNPFHHNAIKVINEIDTRHLGYIVRETADVLTMLLNDNTTFASARAFLSAPGTHNRNLDQDVISCQVLLFFAVPLHLVPPLPPQLRFHEDLSSPDFVLAGTPVALTGYTLHAFDEYKAQYMDSLHLQTLLRPCSTNTNSPVHVRDSDATVPLEPPPQSQVQVPTDEVVIIDHSKRFDGMVESDNSVSGPPTNAETQLLDAEMNEVVCMKCKETGRGLFFQCDQNECPVLVHESCIGVVGHTCLFCLFLACRGERLRVKKGSDLHVALKSKYEQVRKSAIRFFGKRTFMRLRELAGLDPLLPTQVQVPCNANMKCNTKEVKEKEAVGMSTIIEKSASMEKKEKEAVGTSTIIEKSASKEKKEKEAVGTSTIIEKSASKEKKEKEVVGTSTIIEKPLMRPCSTNTNSPIHVRDSDATAPLEPPSRSQVQVPTDEVVIIDHSKRFDGTVESDNSVSGAPTNSETQLLDAEMNEIVCMKCKETGRGLFFQCDQNGCPVLIHESCIGGIVGHTCLFCLFLACRGERLRAKKGSDLYEALKSKYEQVRKSAIRFFGKKTFMRLRELTGLDPLLPTQVQVKCNTKEGREKEAVGTSIIIEKSASKEKKEKVVGHGKRRLSPRLSHDRACKKIKQASSPLW